MKTIGSRAEVFHGNADHTSGGLEKSDLLKNKRGRIVSARKHKTAKKHLVELLPENPDYQAIKVDLRESEFQIEGLSVGVLRRGN